MEKELKNAVKIRFQDCDPFNHLNNSKYLDYFLNMREDQLIENYDIDIYKHSENTGNGWIIASNQICYLKPALANEKVLIVSKLIKYGKRTLNVEMIMWDEAQSEIKSIYWTQNIYFNTKTHKSVSHSTELMKLFKETVVPTEQDYFEERCRFILRNSNQK